MMWFVCWSSRAPALLLAATSFFLVLPKLIDGGESTPELGSASFDRRELQQDHLGLYGRVLEDSNCDGTGDVPVSGVLVSMYQDDTLYSTNTFADDDGYYFLYPPFDLLGGYTVSLNDSYIQSSVPMTFDGIADGTDTYTSGPNNFVVTIGRRIFGSLWHVEDDGPLVDEVVILNQVTGSYLASTSTDSYGSYFFDGYPATGNYILSLKNPITQGSVPLYSAPRNYSFTFDCVLPRYDYDFYLSFDSEAQPPLPLSYNPVTSPMVADSPVAPASPVFASPHTSPHYTDAPVTFDFATQPPRPLSVNPSTSPITVTEAPLAFDSPAPVFTSPITITEAPVGDDSPAPVFNAPTTALQYIDAPVTSLHTISGSVQEDEDDDNDGDRGIVDVVVNLLNSSNEVIATTTTDINGDFEFTNILAGVYGLMEINPPGFVDVSDYDGGDPNMITPIQIFDGNTNGLVFVNKLGSPVPSEPARIRGRVLEDSNGDGIGDTPLWNVIVPRLDGDGTGFRSGFTTTDTNGYYSFEAFPAGNYIIDLNGSEVGPSRIPIQNAPTISISFDGTLPFDSSDNDFVVNLSRDRQSCYWDSCGTPTPLCVVTPFGPQCVADCNTISCPAGSVCREIGVNGYPECVQDTEPERFTEFPWFAGIAATFDSSGGNRLRLCGKRKDQQPPNGQGCAAKPKTCFFRTQLCNDGTPTPMTECYCDGSAGNQEWKCKPISCPDLPTGGVCPAQFNGLPQGCSDGCNVLESTTLSCPAGQMCCSAISGCGIDCYDPVSL